AGWWLLAPPTTAGTSRERNCLWTAASHRCKPWTAQGTASGVVPLGATVDACFFCPYRCIYRLMARGGAMATRVEELPKAGWGTGRAVTLAPQARRLVERPVLPTRLRLAAPTVALMLLQGVIAAGEAAFVGRLGSAALAGVSLSFPLVMLMTTLSAGAYGGGVASGVARALGAGRVEDA